jgi:GntR family transcriptional regulator
MSFPPVYDPFPKYLQIREVLLRWLSSRNVGDMLPTEEKLAKQFRVSRMTIREALKSFEEDGLIVRRARVGTWLARPVPLALDRRFTGPIENFGRLGTPTRTVLVSRAYINPPAEIAAVLRVSNKKKIIREKGRIYFQG